MEFEIIFKNHMESAKQKISQYNVEYINPIFACNYRVPEIFRKGNEDAYTPRVVSIGPIHRGRPHLQAMERYKWKFLGKYLDRNLVDLETVVRLMVDIDYEARMFYLDRFDNISKLEFSEMIMLDFIFLIELLQLDIPTDPTISHGNAQKNEFNDPWIKRDITHDVVLLENQLPLPLVTLLFDLLYIKDFSGNAANRVSNLILNYFKNNIRTSPNAIQIQLDPTVTDIVDFFVKCQHNQINSGTTHIVIEMDPRARIATEMRQRTHSATELHEEAGVKFSNLINAACLLDVKFGNGLLEIPVIRVDSLTETIFLNMMASEQSRTKKSTRISGYILLMSALIKSPEDVVLLENCGIIENDLANKEQVARLFDNLSKYIVVDDSGSYFVDLYKRLHLHSKTYWHYLWREARLKWKGSWFNWMQILKHDYFSNPWTTTSVIAAFILLVLTIIQTVCAIIQI